MTMKPTKKSSPITPSALIRHQLLIYTYHAAKNHSRFWRTPTIMLQLYNGQKVNSRSMSWMTEPWTRWRHLQNVMDSVIGMRFQFSHESHEMEILISMAIASEKTDQDWRRPVIFDGRSQGHPATFLLSSMPISALDLTSFLNLYPNILQTTKQPSSNPHNSFVSPKIKHGLSKVPAVFKNCSIVLYRWIAIVGARRSA